MLELPAGAFQKNFLFKMLLNVLSMFRNNSRCSVLVGDVGRKVHFSKMKPREQNCISQNSTAKSCH